MILLLRFIGVMNAAIWFGSAVFVLAAAPVFFSATVQSTPLGKFWPGVMVQFVFERLFYVQCVCATVGIAHQLAEWVYLGRNLQRWVMIVLGALLLFTLAEGLILQPRMRSLYLVKYGLNDRYAAAQYPVAERLQAEASFKQWHRVSRIAGLFATLSLGALLWKVVHPEDNPRFVASKFRG